MPEKATGAVALNYVVWGLLPLFWKLLDNVNSPYVLAHRILWATVFSGMWLLLTAITVSRSGRTRPVFSGISARLIFSSLVITVNWGVYIWAVNGGFVSYAALGYFVSPLLSVLLGSMFFREPISGWQSIAIFLTAGAALFYGWGQSGIGLVVVFGIAVTFSVYGAIKKSVKIDAVPGMFAESSILAPVAVVLLLTGTLTSGDSIGGTTWALLVVSGLVTLLPLIVLSHYARFVPLSTLGMLQFILPVVQLTLGVVVFGEVVSVLQALALFFIVTGVVLYLFDGHQSKGQQTSNSL